MMYFYFVSLHHWKSRSQKWHQTVFDCSRCDRVFGMLTTLPPPAPPCLSLAPLQSCMCVGLLEFSGLTTCITHLSLSGFARSKSDALASAALSLLVLLKHVGTTCLPFAPHSTFWRGRQAQCLGMKLAESQARVFVLRLQWSRRIFFTIWCAVSQALSKNDSYVPQISVNARIPDVLHYIQELLSQIPMDCIGQRRQHRSFNSW